MRYGLMMAAILAFLSAEAAVVALFRIIRISQGMPIPRMRSSAASPRAMMLWAFAAYMVGGTAREVMVLTFGFMEWPEFAITMSAVARTLQVGGACLFVYALTARFCGHWVWLSSLAMAILFGAVMVSI